MAAKPLPYREWAEVPGLSPSQRSPGADIAGDGTPNALKYVLGYTPTMPIPKEMLPNISRTLKGEDPYLILEMDRNPNALEASCHVDISHDLLTWRGQGEDIMILEDSSTRFRAGARIIEGQPLFLRLRLELDHEPIPWSTHDSFNRADTGAASGDEVADVIGGGWYAGTPEANWRLIGGALDLQHTIGNATIYHLDLPTPGWEGTAGFTLEGTVRIDTTASTGWAGILAHFDPEHTEGTGGLVFRYNGAGKVQLLDPSGRRVFEVEEGFEAVRNRPYRLTLRSTGNQTYDLLILDTVSDRVVFSAIDVDNHLHPASPSGFAGFFANTGVARFDDFSLKVHAWQEFLTVAPTEAWGDIGSGTFVEGVGGLEPLSGETFWTPSGSSSTEGIWISLDRHAEPGEVTVRYFAGKREDTDWNPVGSAHLWVAPTGSNWSWNRRIIAVAQHHGIPDTGWMAWMETYRIDTHTMSADSAPALGNPLGFAFQVNPSAGEQSPAIDRVHIAFTPQPRQTTTVVYDPVEGDGSWTAAALNQFVSSGPGLEPSAGEEFWSVSGTTGNRQPRKIFDKSLKPGYWSVSYRVGKLQGFEFPSADNTSGPRTEAFLWANTDGTGDWTWDRRLQQEIRMRPDPQDGWEWWTDLYTLTSDTKTMGSAVNAPNAVDGLPFGFVFRTLDLNPAYGIAFDDLRIQHHAFEPHIDPRSDPSWFEGMTLYHPDPADGAVVVDTLDFGRPGVEPRWTLAEWWTNYPLEGASPQTLRPGGIGYANAAKEVILTPPGNPDAGLILRVNGNIEYNGQVPSSGQPWPHLFVSQRLRRDASLSLDRLDAVKVSAKLRLTHFESFHHSGAAQYFLYFTVQNLNRQSDDFGNYFWLGLHYDNRFNYTPLYISVDTGGEYKPGTNKMIYNPAMAAFVDRPIGSGEWTNLQGDLLPHMLDAFQEALNRGYIAADSSLSDYFVATLTLGWEVPGLYNVSMQLRDLDLRLVRKLH